MIEFSKYHKQESPNNKKLLYVLLSTILLILSMTFYIGKKNMQGTIQHQQRNIQVLEHSIDQLGEQLAQQQLKINDKKKQAIELPFTYEMAAESEQLDIRYIAIDYAKAQDMVRLMETHQAGLLSDKATLSYDERVNAVLIQDTQTRLDAAERFIKSIDQPVKQVLIEARIVIVDNEFKEELGIKYDIGYQNRSTQKTNSIHQKSPLQSINTNSILGIAWGKLDGKILLDLELAAVQAEGRGEVISSPRLLTGHQQTAYIQAGEEIPYEHSAGNGATSVTFKQAVLGLEVTPQITPKNEVIIDLIVSQDSRGELIDGRIPTVNTQKIATQVLVNDGETLVLGGIIKQRQREHYQRVPFLGTIPIVGWLFTHRVIHNSREELLIFITPTIIDQARE